MGDSGGRFNIRRSDHADALVLANIVRTDALAVMVRRIKTSGWPPWAMSGRCPRSGPRLAPAPHYDRRRTARDWHAAA